MSLCGHEAWGEARIPLFFQLPAGVTQLPNNLGPELAPGGDLRPQVNKRRSNCGGNTNAWERWGLEGPRTCSQGCGVFWSFFGEGGGTCIAKARGAHWQGKRSVPATGCVKSWEIPLIHPDARNKVENYKIGIKRPHRRKGLPPIYVTLEGPIHL